ncbi:MAG: hypothetical protein QNK36_01155 [Colwellia sp.]|nr:hypothetical protein [Colwellia sp.]
MHRRSSRLKGVFVIFSSMLLAVSVCAVFYYFKIKQNENYQNQLHFREVKDMNQPINNGVEQLKNLTDISTPTIKSLFCQVNKTPSIM